MVIVTRRNTMSTTSKRTSIMPRPKRPRHRLRSWRRRRPAWWAWTCVTFASTSSTVISTTSPARRLSSPTIRCKFFILFLQIYFQLFVNYLLAPCSSPGALATRSAFAAASAPSTPSHCNRVCGSMLSRGNLVLVHFFPTFNDNLTISVPYATVASNRSPRTNLRGCTCVFRCCWTSRMAATTWTGRWASTAFASSSASKTAANATPPICPRWPPSKVCVQFCFFCWIQKPNLFVFPPLDWDHLQTIDSLLRKGGHRGPINEKLRRSIRLTRYTSEKLSLSFQDWATSRAIVF